MTLHRFAEGQAEEADINALGDCEWKVSPSYWCDCGDTPKRHGMPVPRLGDLGWGNCKAICQSR